VDGTVVVSTLLNNKTMPESSDGMPDPKEGTSTNGNTESRRRSERRGHRDGGKFEGKCVNLKSSTYNVTGAGRDTFIKTTREIAEYIGRTYEDAGEFRTSLVELSLLDLVQDDIGIAVDVGPIFMGLHAIANSLRALSEHQCKCSVGIPLAYFCLVFIPMQCLSP
jgi:hypothetical protein